MKTAVEIQAILDNAHGTERYYKVSPICGAPVATDGVVALANAAACFWLLDEIISNQKHKALQGQDMQVWTLKRVKEAKDNEDEWDLRCTDGNDNMLVSRSIEFSDFPLDEITLWVMPGGPKGLDVILLPSEH